MSRQADRELLEMAAKAACLDNPEYAESVSGKWHIYHGAEGNKVAWNPIEDDADAFLLALNLEMPIHPGRVWKNYPANCYGGFAEASRDVTPISDPESTRRAITEVAAEVGRYGK